MTWWSFTLIMVSLVAFVAGQLFLKHGMESSSAKGFRDAAVRRNLICGIASMAVHFFLTLGLLQKFDLSYIYPFQGLSVIFICIAAAIVLRERLTLQLAIGSLLISAGVVLVSLS
jgi:uncharacterized membrane protein